MIRFKTGGSFKKTKDFLDWLYTEEITRDLDHYGQMGVDSLAIMTPKDTGLTAASWYYEIINRKGVFGIAWHNDNIQNGINVAIILQYGHGTGTGGYVAGYDYINPAIQPVFDQIAEDVWRSITSA